MIRIHCDEDRRILETKLLRAISELDDAGEIHRRDLLKHISRLRREIRRYDFRQRVHA